MTRSDLEQLVRDLVVIGAQDRVEWLISTERPEDAGCRSIHVSFDIAYTL